MLYLHNLKWSDVDANDTLMGLFREILQKEDTVTTHLQTKHSVEDEQFNKMLKYHATRQRLERTTGGGLPYLLFNAQRMAGNQSKTVLK